MACSHDGCSKNVLCKGVCRNHYMQEYRGRLENKPKVKKMWDKWYSKNQDSYKETRYKQRNTDQYRKYARECRYDRYHSDVDFQLRCCLRTAFNRVMSGSDSSMFQHLGCTIEELKLHLESKFQDNMSWDNYGKWHIDHIRPLSAFNDNAHEAFYFTNLQPLWARDNLKKSNKYA